MHQYKVLVLYSSNFKISFLLIRILLSIFSNLFLSFDIISMTLEEKNIIPGSKQDLSLLTERIFYS